MDSASANLAPSATRLVWRYSFARTFLQLPSRESWNLIGRSFFVAAQRVIALGLLLLFCGALGCRIKGNDGPVPRALLTCREYSQQASRAIDQGNWQDAESLLAKAVRAYPDDAEARRQYAEALAHRNDHRRAMEQLQSAVKCQRGDPRLLVDLAEVQMKLRLRQEAAESIEQAMELDPRLADVWLARGRWMEDSGQLRQALADYHRALSLDPGNRQVLSRLASLHLELSQPERALGDLQSLADTYAPGEEPAQLLSDFATVYSVLGRFEDAEAQLVAAVERFPNSADLHFRLAEVQWLGGSRRQALLTLDQALSVDHSHAASLHLQQQINLAEAQDSKVRR